MRAQTMTSIGARWISTDPDTRVGLLQAQACNMRSKCRCSCVLQFTFCHAFSSVLHRPPSQLIHCIALFLLFRWKRKKKLEKLEIAPSVAGLCCTFVYSNPGGDCHRAERAMRTARAVAAREQASSRPLGYPRTQYSARGQPRILF